LEGSQDTDPVFLVPAQVLPRSPRRLWRV